MSALTKSLQDVAYRTAMLYVLAYTYKKDEEFNLDDFAKIMKNHYPTAFECYDAGTSRFTLFVHQMKSEEILLPLEDKHGNKNYRFAGINARTMQTFVRSKVPLDPLRARHAEFLPPKVPTPVPEVKEQITNIVEKFTAPKDPAQELKSRISDLTALIEKLPVPNEKAAKIAEKFPFLLDLPEEKIAKLQAVISII